MQFKQQPGRQTNENLVQRTKVDWSSLINCESIISEAVSMYHKGDEKIPPHRVNSFLKDRANKHTTLKVINGVKSEEGSCPFLFN